jgi:hypothetical protein
LTIAICAKCGVTKFGAFNPCDQCGYEPPSTLEKAKSILLSDHHHTKAELEMIGEAIRSGRPVAYDPVALATYERTLDIMESNPEALACPVFGEDLNSLDETFCRKCRESKDK